LIFDFDIYIPPFLLSASYLLHFKKNFKTSQVY